MSQNKDRTVFCEVFAFMASARSPSPEPKRFDNSDKHLTGNPIPSFVQIIVSNVGPDLPARLVGEFTRSSGLELRFAGVEVLNHPLHEMRRRPYLRRAPSGRVPCRSGCEVPAIEWCALRLFVPSGGVPHEQLHLRSCSGPTGPLVWTSCSNSGVKYTFIGSLQMIILNIPTMANPVKVGHVLSFAADCFKICPTAWWNFCSIERSRFG